MVQYAYMNVHAVPDHFKADRMDDVQIARFNPEKGTIENWIAYASKVPDRTSRLIAVTTGEYFRSDRTSSD